MNKEVWKDIAGFEGLYQVSDSGQVRSLNYRHTGQTRNLKPGKSGNGHLLVNLCKDGKRNQFWIHRLVAEAFLPNPRGYPCINHKDENPLNNVVSNLEWCSVLYNNCYGTVLKRRAAKKSKPVSQYDKDGNLIQIWPSATEAQRTLGFNNGFICRCCLGKLKSAYGFVWRYAP